MVSLSPGWRRYYDVESSGEEKNAGTVYHCRLPPSADPLRGEH
ncbi:hypothetical protein [Phormidium nigroviride]